MQGHVRGRGRQLRWRHQGQGWGTLRRVGGGSWVLTLFRMSASGWEQVLTQRYVFKSKSSGPIGGGSVGYAHDILSYYMQSCTPGCWRPLCEGGAHLEHDLHLLHGRQRLVLGAAEGVGGRHHDEEQHPAGPDIRRLEWRGDMDPFQWACERVQERGGGQGEGASK